MCDKLKKNTLYLEYLVIPCRSVLFPQNTMLYIILEMYGFLRLSPNSVMYNIRFFNIFKLNLACKWKYKHIFISGSVEILEISNKVNGFLPKIMKSALTLYSKFDNL